MSDVVFVCCVRPVLQLSWSGRHSVAPAHQPAPPGGRIAALQLQLMHTHARTHTHKHKGSWRLWHISFFLSFLFFIPQFFFICLCFLHLFLRTSCSYSSSCSSSSSVSSSLCQECFLLTPHSGAKHLEHQQPIRSFLWLRRAGLCLLIGLSCSWFQIFLMFHQTISFLLQRLKK